MLFASTSLAARIERAQWRLVTDSAESILRRQENEDVFGSKSAENAQRQGFAMLYTRAILVRSAPERGALERSAPERGALERGEGPVDERVQP